ncbi:DUF2135 domain-containing protein [Allomuricauda sp. SCSIO 65647]|uniref:DUF2135 domain-containing protein n=1 Tax=Allomuricauda sp. SCSIO 65647 TaxID=2908843 RepID=UPI001F1B9435|nr:DUF2135 domain-containing protein [Muricauda sp. SCSIO 65647]UJH67135.1 DUF2135 domain-containing protein [Muricauda sp. SCSIO 65647]
MKNNCTLFTLLCCCSLVFSQQHSITGTVMDEGAPLSDVDIKIANQGMVSQSDNHGRYQVDASEGDLLVYSKQGMEPIEIRVEDVTRTLNVEMFPKVKKLKNVTVAKKKWHSQKELEKDYHNNPNIVKTAFGYLDRTKATYAVRMINTNNILPGEYDLSNALRGRLAGVRVNGSFSGISSFGRGARSVFTRSGTPAIYDIDGQIFTEFPNFLDVQSIERIAVISSLFGTMRYGSFGRGGVVVINTKAGVRPPTDKNGFVIDRARLRNNIYEGDALTQENMAKNEPEYLKALTRSNSFEEAKSTFESNFDRYSFSPYFILDSYRYFYDRWGKEEFADSIIEDAYASLDNHPVHLKSLAYIYEAQGRFDKAYDTYRDVFILRPQYAQSYLDLANSNRSIKNVKRAAVLYVRYFHLLNRGLIQSDSSTFSGMIKRDFGNLLAVENIDKISKSIKKKDFAQDENLENTRLVFEWSNSEAEFELQFVNSDNRHYTWKHNLRENPLVIEKEKEHGYSSTEYFIDDLSEGPWQVNVNYLGNKSLTPTYLKATVYYDYGTKAQRKEIKVFKLGLKNVNQELFSLQKGNLIAAR